MTITSDMRRLQRRGGGGRLTITLPEAGTGIVACLYPSGTQARESVIARLERTGAKSVELGALAEQIHKQELTSLYAGRGGTLDEAMDDLGRKIAEAPRG